MRAPIIRRLSPALLLLLLAAGCELSPTSMNDDEAAIQSLVTEEADFFTADLFGDDGAESPTTPRTLADIDPWRWGRHIDSVTRDITIQIEDPAEGPTTALVTWNATLAGTFHVVDSDTVHYQKPFVADAVRYATFERRDGMSTMHRGWRLTSISGTEVVSDPVTVAIVQVNLASTGGLDTTFSDVSTLADRENILKFAAGDTVTVTVTTGNTDDVVLLHYPAWRMQDMGRHHLREMMTNNGDGTYTGTWVVRGSVRGLHNASGPRHVTVDVLSNGTIYTDDQPYDSEAWSFVYAAIAP